MIAFIQSLLDILRQQRPGDTMLQSTLNSHLGLGARADVDLRFVTSFLQDHQVDSPESIKPIARW